MKDNQENLLLANLPLKNGKRKLSRKKNCGRRRLRRTEQKGQWNGETQ